MTTTLPGVACHACGEHIDAADVTSVVNVTATHGDTIAVYTFHPVCWTRRITGRTPPTDPTER